MVITTFKNWSDWRILSRKWNLLLMLPKLLSVKLINVNIIIQFRICIQLSITIISVSQRIILSVFFIRVRHDSRRRIVVHTQIHDSYRRIIIIVVILLQIGILESIKSVF